MRYSFLFIILFQYSSVTFGQLKPASIIPIYYIEQKNFSDSLAQIIRDADLNDSYDAGEDGMEKISFAVIKLSGKKPVIGGVNMDNFIYPASVYKMYVAMEILKQVSEGKYSLYKSYVVHSPNDVDVSSEISWDPRPLLKAGDTVTIRYLLDLMITRSDNSAANCLIDVAGRENINKTMHQYGWFGSEVTRKYLSRKLEDSGYAKVVSTATNALHAADFMYKIYTNQLVNPWVSMEMKTLLGGQLDTTKLARGLPPNTMFYHKSGWWSYYTNDVGIVDDGSVKYIIALFTPVTEDKARGKIRIVSERVYQLLRREK
ncbi:MAG: serine hydrolase [Ginsengibacter sp.]